MSLTKKMVAVQSALKAPKSQHNSFGRYSYRNQEDILEAVKPLLAANELTMSISDEVIEVAGMVIISAKVEVTDGESVVVTRAQAGVDPNRKGMDIAQSFGSSSSYARKYALNGMFLIDDTKDADATNVGKSAPSASKASASAASVDEDWFSKGIDYIKGSSNKQQALEMITSKYGKTASEKQLAALAKFVS